MARRLLLALALGLAAHAAGADGVSVSSDKGYARLLFTLTPKAQATATANGGALTVSFDRKVAIDPSALAQALPAYIGSARIDADGKALHFALAQRVRVHSSASENKFAVDLAPASFAGTPPDLPLPPVKVAAPVDPNTLPVLKVRAGAYKNFTRLVFDWPKEVPYTVFPGAGKTTLRFAALARPDFTALVRRSPPWVKNAAWHIESRFIVVEFETDQDSGYHDFRDGARVVLDVLAPKTDADAYAPPGTPKIKPTIVTATGAQMKEIAAAAAKLNGTRQPAEPAPPPPPPPAPTAAPPPAVESAAAEGKLTRDGAVMIFTGASRKGSAVFLRGLTAWIVLQDAPPLDAVKLKTQLGSFPAAVDAQTSGNVSILRVTLKAPEEIAAYSDGSNLKVVIAARADPKAVAIGFSRNQDDATHSSMTALLPGATRAVTLADPAAGDSLIVVPAAAGRASTEERSYVEFRSLRTASGLVLQPLVDDLSVTLNSTRITITRNGGLSLTPPSMPVAESPQALAHGGAGPSYLNFAQWGDAYGASFLSQQRRLRADIARLPGEAANRARLKLAQFYLAHGFAAEAIGLVDLMRAADPSLQGDRRLLVMRAAADYQMGRLSDAYNDIAGTAFDADRHAALWRGLIETAREDWHAAGTDLERAKPVLALYPEIWQARARLAIAEAALGRGNLEVADAALARLPASLPPDLRVAAQLERARLYAAEDRLDEAAHLFAAVEKSGDEREAARSIFYRVSAGTANKTLPPKKAIAELERLRFRWRGDALEMKTLRKLSQLYFGAGKWREGLNTLRLAAESFPGEDMSRRAQDDMRAAFVTLFLKGGADKLPPVQALSLFYDNLDQTPIGPEGDEMIRRMADRLVAVDLLGPASDLLKYQIDKRLDGVARAQVAAKLAGIYLLDRKPEAALGTIRSTMLTGLPEDLGHQRLMLEAQALAGLKRTDDALDMLDVDKSIDAARLRADIYWQAGRWAEAGRAAEEALGTSHTDEGPMDEAARQQAMRAAVAYSLANDEPSLDRLRDRFGPKMRATPDGSAFAVVSARIDAHGIAFRDAAAEVASVDTLKGFMKDLRARD